MKLVDSLAKLPHSLVTALALFLCIAVGVVDGVVGHVYSLVPFYLVPVVLAAWCVGRKTGYLLSFICSLGWLSAELAAGLFLKADFAMYWNDAMKLLLFVLTTTVISALKEALERENVLARTDHLTGIPNRRSYYESVSGEIRRNLRYYDPFTIVYLDIDNFKNVNDTRGHAGGDTLLKLVASVLAKSVREIDTVARLGGDEFALLLPETDGDAADIVATKVRQRLKMNVENHWPVTFSMGLVTYHKAPATIDKVIGYADRLMFKAKEGGKDAICCEVVGEMDNDKAPQDF
ncbi:MAG TPA: GGDEF domain-containing protein [Desulfuromonadales bacterium]|nr:GGDEF domain-containing protein [Desulfuromonadales bacterium]